MQNSTIVLLSVALLSSTATVTPLLSNSTNSPAPQHQNLTEAEVETRLETIIIEDFKMAKIPLSKALEQLDAITEPHGIQIVFRKIDDRDPIVDLKTRNLSLARNLSFLSQQCGYDWTVDMGVVIVAQPGTNEALVTDIIPVRSPTVRRLSKIGGQ
ncbi:hypothetical protein [Coraliomargarita parva]|uniref:hypothetical protein n=1 Tax=Coraliomargarita parva TaxID=3014050 RepID=UPI0022B3CCB7|nr:hypothetical protein [Coraliomargarita parva]